MRNFILFSLLLIIVSSSFAQSDFRKNDIYLEIAGSGNLGSLNYERQLTNLTGFGIRVGLGCYIDNAFFLSVPIGVNYLLKFPNERSLIDVGAGVTWLSNDPTKFTESNYPTNEGLLNFVPTIGYRRHTRGNLMWRVNFSPFFNEYGFFPWFGLSFGKRF